RDQCPTSAAGGEEQAAIGAGSQPSVAPHGCGQREHAFGLRATPVDNERRLTIRTDGGDPIVSQARLPWASFEEPPCSSAAFEADQSAAERHHAATEAQQRDP